MLDLEAEQKAIMIGMYAQGTNTDRIGTLQGEINRLMEIEVKKEKPKALNPNDYVLREVPAWQL